MLAGRLSSALLSSRDTSEVSFGQCFVAQAEDDCRDKNDLTSSSPSTPHSLFVLAVKKRRKPESYTIEFSDVNCFIDSGTRTSQERSGRCHKSRFQY